MDLGTLGNEIAKLGLPVLGAALAAPTGGASLAIATALSAMIGSPSAKPEDVLATLQGNADAVVKAKQFEYTHQETLLKIQLDAQNAQVQADLADVESARQMQMVTKDWYPRTLGILLTLGFFGLLAYMLRFEVPQSNASILSAMLGTLATAWVAMVHFTYGSTRDSARKTELIAQQAQSNNASAPSS